MQRLVSERTQIPSSEDGNDHDRHHDHDYNHDGEGGLELEEEEHGAEKEERGQDCVVGTKTCTKLSECDHNHVAHKVR